MLWDCSEAVYEHHDWKVYEETVELTTAKMALCMLDARDGGVEVPVPSTIRSQ